MPFYNKLDLIVEKVEEGSYSFTGKLEVINTSTVRITEIPPILTLSTYRDVLDELEENGKIQSYIDKSSESINLEVKLKRADLSNYTEEQLIDLLKLKKVHKERIVAVDFDNTKVLQFSSPQEVVQKFVDWRLSWFEIRYQNLRDKELKYAEYLDCVMRCVEGEGKIKPLTQLISSKPTREKIIERITQLIDVKFNDPQEVISKICSISIDKWTEEVHQDLVKKLEESLDKIDYYEEMINDPEKRKKQYIQELTELKRERF